MFRRFIDRPVLSTVISILLVLLGILGLIGLPIAQYPDISPPTVSVSANYAGANAEVVLNSVIVPLEEQINGVEDMTYMTSSATNEGSGSINVFFKVGTNPDQAAVNVQNRVSRATSLLPADVTRSGVTVEKRQNSNLLIFAIYSDNPIYDQTFLQNYATINIIPQIQRINGVGSASAFGSRTFSMRIWLKPDVMAVYGLTPDDVNAALNEQNIEAAPGKFGESGNQSFQYVIKYTGRLKTVEEFENIIIKSASQGHFLRLKDVARVELGAQAYSSYNTTNGKPAVGVAIAQTPGSNARDVINNSKKVIEEAAKTFPEGIHFKYLVDINKFLDASISKVFETLLEAFVLVFIVVFLFLQNFRATLIPAISVPVAVIGTFFFLYLFGFSINLLTLFAIVLAIGIVVDDAIVVVEAVHAKLDQGYKSAHKASVDAMNEISGAIISITLVMAAVFVPVTFISGSSGVFYKQFGLTLATAIVLSAVNALTLSPALSALFLKPHDKDHEKKNFKTRFYAAFNASYDALSARYLKSVGFLTRKMWVPVAGIVVFIVGLFMLMKTTPSSFVPNEDMGVIFTSINLPPASSLERSDAVSRKVDSIATSILEVENAMRIVGRNFISGQGSAYSMVILELKPWEERKNVSNLDVIDVFTQKTADIKEGDIRMLSLPTITGFGFSGGFEFQLQDKAGHTLEEFFAVSRNFLAALNSRPEIQFAITPFNPGFPQYQLSVNVAKCKEAGVAVNDVLGTMQTYYGSTYVSNFNQFGKQYRVLVQADTSYRASPAGLNKIYVRNAKNEMAPITEFIELVRIYGPESISRFNMFTSMGINGSPKPGYSSGDAIIAIQEVAAQTLPSGYGYEFSGVTREEISSGQQSVYIFILCLIFVYFILCAQYESYLLPFAVILSLPVGLSGSFLFARLFHVDNNIYMQISLIMLIGLLSKNAILIVEYAAQRRRRGMGITEAAMDGARARLRPILMTSLAFIFGLSPLLFASGAGANGNHSIGVGAIGGMLGGTLLGIFAIPPLFVIFQTIQEKFKRKRPDDEDDTVVVHANV
jgi:HAE1 family hydrophobic/amphiphilic exporter-1